MAHQAHNISWGSLVKNFEYTNSKHTGGNRNIHDIYALDRPDQVKSLLHFARTFSQSIRDYAATERRKYPPAKDYRHRAKSWTQSDRRPDVEVENAPRPQLRAGSTERKKVFSDRNRDLWRARRNVYYQNGLIDETQYIDNWILGEAHWIEHVAFVKSNIRDKWVGNWTDNVKALMMEAALVTVPLHQRQSKRDQQNSEHLECLDTLFLLAHHPDIPLLDWTCEADCCCYFESGLICIVEAALTGYIYLNMMCAMRETGSKAFRPTDEIVPSKSWRCRVSPAQVKLSPRPRYMNTASWHACLGQTCHKHYHHPETMMFQPFLFPLENENFSLVTEKDGKKTLNFEEVDVLTPSSSLHNQESQDPLSVRGSSAALHEFLRGLWKLMVIYEMLWTEQGQPPYWEGIVVEQLEKCFRGVTGKRYSLLWDDYDQSDTYRVKDLFEGKVQREHSPPAATIQEKSQKAKNRDLRSQARRQAKEEDRLRSCMGGNT